MKKLLAAVTVLAVSTAQADTIYVDDDIPCGDGSSWESALSDLQRAIDIASETATVSEILVAGGVYPPTFQVFPQLPRSKTFYNLPDDVVIRLSSLVNNVRSISDPIGHDVHG